MLGAPPVVAPVPPALVPPVVAEPPVGPLPEPPPFVPELLAQAASEQAAATSNVASTLKGRGFIFYSSTESALREGIGERLIEAVAPPMSFHPDKVRARPRVDGAAAAPPRCPPLRSSRPAVARTGRVSARSGSARSFRRRTIMEKRIGSKPSRKADVRAGAAYPSSGRRNAAGNNDATGTPCRSRVVRDPTQPVQEMPERGRDTTRPSRTSPDAESRIEVETRTL